MTRNTICLAMMVRNEFNFIVLALESVAPYIDYIVILDSQSDDGTLELLEAFQEHHPEIKMEVHQYYTLPFRADQKRTKVMELARDKADYILQIDADNMLEVELEDLYFPFNNLTANVYHLTKIMGGLKYPVPLLFKNGLDWRFEGVIHEYPTAPDMGEPVLLPGVIIHEAEKTGAPGSRVRDLKRHYFDHALTIERELLDHGLDLPAHLIHRYTFYLANSYKDCSMIPRALDAYRARIALGGWVEEVFYSYFMIAKITGKPEDWLTAWNYRPQRRDCCYYAMIAYLDAGLISVAYAIGSVTAALPVCGDKLFQEYNIINDKFPALLNELALELKK